MFAVIVPQNGHAQETSSSSYLSLVLIPADLEDATKAMTVHDSSGDGFIDAKEQKRIAWRSQVGEHDLDKDGRLTHLEVALRFAGLRGESGVIQIDRKFADKHLRQHDRNQNGQLDPSEIAHGWPEEAEEFDKNSDGVLTLGEIAEMLAFQRKLRKELGIMGVDQGGAKKIFNRFDRNSDNKLDASEWDAASLPREPKNFDEDDDGELSVMELATMLAKNRMESGMSTSDQMQVRNLVLRIDRDRNGVISRDEFDLAKSAGFTNEEFSKYDTDKNGEVTVAEVEKGFGSARKQMGYSDQHAARATRLMARHDKDRSGYLEKSELFKQANAGELSVEMFEKFDLDGDEKITSDELARRLARQENESP